MKVLSTVLAGALALGLAAVDAGQAFAKQEGDFVVRLRGIALLPDADGTTDALGGDADVSGAYVPELDFSYFFTDNIAAELILATTKHDVQVDNSTAGDLDLGSVWLLPPTLTLQYHFMPDQMFSPYLGAGVNYTIIYNEKAGASVNDVSYTDEFGFALQAGFDIAIDEKWSLNADVKKIFLDTDITVNGGAINAKGTALDPLVVGIGFGYKF